MMINHFGYDRRCNDDQDKGQKDDSEDIEASPVIFVRLEVLYVEP
jgi:hypothetical protein